MSAEPPHMRLPPESLRLRYVGPREVVQLLLFLDAATQLSRVKDDKCFQLKIVFWFPYNTNPLP